MPQLDASVVRDAPPPLTLSGGNIEPPEQKWLGLVGTAADLPQLTVFPTVPASFDANRHYYPGLAKSYLGAAVVETPQHSQIQYSTFDIPSIQLSMRGPISPQVLQRWQLSQVSAATIPR